MPGKAFEPAWDPQDTAPTGARVLGVFELVLCSELHAAAKAAGNGTSFMSMVVPAGMTPEPTIVIPVAMVEFLIN